MNKNIRPNNSWNRVSKWYSKITSGDGHYYHKNIIIPKVLKLLKLDEKSSVLDLGCGSGVLGRSISKDTTYLGVDISRNLIEQARKNDKSRKHEYKVGDATSFKSNIKFSDVLFILSLQNMEKYEEAITNASNYLNNNGKLYLILNHPYFRIPRQTSWEVDTKTKLEYRRINLYMSKMSIPINMNPSEKNSEYTWSYHIPLHEISKILKTNNLNIERIEEWTSDKTSEGKNSKMENRARSEFPMFMTIVAKKAI